MFMFKSMVLLQEQLKEMQNGNIIERIYASICKKFIIYKLRIIKKGIINIEFFMDMYEHFNQCDRHCYKIPYIDGFVTITAIGSDDHKAMQFTLLDQKERFEQRFILNVHDLDIIDITFEDCYNVIYKYTVYGALQVTTVSKFLERDIIIYKINSTIMDIIYEYFKIKLLERNKVKKNDK